MGYARLFAGSVQYAGRMRVRLLFFGVLRELAGAPEWAMVVEEGTTVADLVRRCEQALPATEIWVSIATAVNQEYTGRERVLGEGDEVALLPPVSGGRGDANFSLNGLVRQRVDRSDLR